MVEIFFSYVPDDRQKFQIPLLIELLEKKPGVQVVHYSEKYSSDSIVQIC